MPIDTKHPNYLEFAPDWDQMRDSLKGQRAIKNKNEEYLPMTGGMEKNDTDGKQYNAYKSRARFPEITTSALTGMIGLIFEKEPIGASDLIITNSGMTNTQLTRDVVRAVGSKGRDILIVDAPQKDDKGNGGGSPFIARYAAETFINWKTAKDNPAELTMAVFEEDVPLAGEDEYSHKTEKGFRKYEWYEGKPTLTLWNAKKELIGGPTPLSIDFMPIICAGSIDAMPACDPLPLLPVSDCAIAYYKKSASYENALYLSCNPTPTISGVDQKQYDAIVEQGIGSSALWYLGEDGKAAFLETTGADIAEVWKAMQGELKQAESYAVRLTQSTSGVEAAAAIAMRAATQHASIYSVSDSVSISVNRAQQFRAQWAGETEPDEFSLRTEFEETYAGEQMINALNSAINSGNAPQSAIFEAIRKAGLSEADNDQMKSEIETQGGLVIKKPDLADA